MVRGPASCYHRRACSSAAHARVVETGATRRTWHLDRDLAADAAGLTPSQQLAALREWREKRHKDGRVFWYNVTTRATTWRLSDELAKVTRSGCGFPECGAVAVPAELTKRLNRVIAHKLE
eukprot:gene26814-41753_t